MRIQLLYTSFVVSLLACSNISAQDILAKSKESATQAVSTRSAIKKNSVEARQQLMSVINKYKETGSVSANELTLNESSPATSFNGYLVKMNGVFSKKLATLIGNDEVTMEERARTRAGLNMLISAQCLEGKEQGSFVLTKDLEGNDLISFPVDDLKKNTRFGKVENYREGYARFSKDQVFGYLGLCGDEIITAQYRKAEPFNGGRAIVKRVDWHFIDGNGNESEPLENITDAKALNNGITLITLTNGKQAFIDNSYDITKKPVSEQYDVIEPFYQNSVFKVRTGTSVGLVSVYGKVKLEATYEAIEPTSASGVYRVSTNKLIGMMDSSWSIKIKPEFASISNFNKHGLAYAVNPVGGVMLIQKGTYKTTKMYQSISEFNEYGVCIVKDENSKFGLLDAQMNTVVEPKYYSIGNFNEIGLANACLEANKCGFIKYDGTEQIKADFEAVGQFNKYGLTVAKMKVECKGQNCVSDVILDRTGSIIVPASEESTVKQYKYTLTDSLHSSNFIIVNVKNIDSKATQYMLIEKASLKLITGVSYEAVMPLDANGNFRVKKNGVWGIVDATGNILSKPQYTEINRDGETYYAAKNDKGKWGYLNKKGKVHIPFEYEDVTNFKNGYAAVSRGKNKWGVISKFEAKVVPCVFKSVILNTTETKYEVTDVDGTIYIVNEKGECESNCTRFEEIRNKANKQE